MPKKLYHAVTPAEIGEFVQDQSELVVLLPPLSQVLGFLASKRVPPDTRSHATAAPNSLSNIIGGGKQALCATAGFEYTDIDRVATLPEGAMPHNLMRQLIDTVGFTALSQALLAVSSSDEQEILQQMLENVPPTL